MRLPSKYFNRIAALMITIAFAASFSVNAMVYNWDKYDIAFEAPDGGYVPFSFFQDPASVQISWDEMFMTLKRYTKNENTNKKNIEERLKGRALEFNMYDTKMMKIKVKGFKCYSLEGTMPDGTRAIISYLVSDKTATVIEIIVNYLYGNQEVVEDIIKSFSEGNNKMPNEREKPKQKIQKKKDSDKEKKDIEKEKKRKNEKIYEC